MDPLVSIAAYNKEDISVSPTLAEALGVRWGLQMAKELNLQQITVLRKK